MRWLGLLVLLGCAHGGAAGGESLESSVRLFNDGLRWKRFAQASQYVPAAERAAFLRRHLASEDTLHIESIEVRAVQPVEGQDVPTVDVTVIAELFRLPRTVVDKLVLTERWQEHDGVWLLVSTTPDLFSGTHD